MLLRSFILAALGLILSAFTVPAEEITAQPIAEVTAINDATPTGPLTLARAVNIALQYNRALQASYHDALAAGYGKWEAWSAYFPNLSFNSTYYKSESEFYDIEFDPANLPPGFEEFNFGDLGFTGAIYTNQFQLQQVVFDYSVISGIRLANIRTRAAEWQNKAQEQIAAAQTAAAFFDVLRAQELLNVQQQRLALAERQLQTAQTNFDVGLRIRTDVLRAELTRSSAERDLNSAAIAVERAQAVLNRIMGIDLKARHQLDGGELAFYNPPEEMVNRYQELQALFETANRHNPSIQVASTLVEENQEAINATRGEFYPQLVLNGAWGFRDREEPALDKEEWSLTLSARVPIFEGGRKIAKMNRTKEQLTAEQKRYEDTVRTILSSVEQNALALQEEKRNLDIALEAVTVAKENHERFLNLYQEGLAETLDVTQALTELVEAQTNVVTTRYGYLRLYALLLLDLGMIPVEHQIYAQNNWLSALK